MSDDLIARRQWKKEDWDESALLARMIDKDKDKEAFESLYRRFHPRLFRFIYRIVRNEADVGEVINDVMKIVHEKAATYDNNCKPSTWIFGIAKNKIKQHLRKIGNKIPVDEETKDVTSIPDEINPSPKDHNDEEYQQTIGKYDLVQDSLSNKKNAYDVGEINPSPEDLLIINEKYQQIISKYDLVLNSLSDNTRAYDVLEICMDTLLNGDSNTLTRKDYIDEKLGLTGTQQQSARQLIKRRFEQFSKDNKDSEFIEIYKVLFP